MLSDWGRSSRTSFWWTDSIGCPLPHVTWQQVGIAGSKHNLVASRRCQWSQNFSDAHVKSEMNATWFLDGPIRYNPEIGLPEYHIISMEHEYCNGVFHYTITPNSSRIGIFNRSVVIHIIFWGDFSCLVGMLNLKRAIGYHLVQVEKTTNLTQVYIELHSDCTYRRD